MATDSVLNRSRERERESSEEHRGERRSADAMQLSQGFIDRGTGEHQSNQVFSTDGLARTLQGELEKRNPLKIIEGEFP